MTPVGDLPGQVRLGQFPEFHALANVLCPPRHIFLQFLVVVAGKYASIEDVTDIFLGLQDAQEVS
jgi:hypothetical protein